MFDKRALLSWIIVFPFWINHPALAVERAASNQIVTFKNVDLVPGVTEQKIVITESDSGAEVIAIGNRLGKKIVTFESSKLLPNVKNKYSPASFDGFKIEFFKGKYKLLSAVDVQGKVTDYNYNGPSDQGVLNLVTKEEDNASYVFNIQFQYDEKQKEIRVSRVIYVAANESCDRSVLSAYVLAGTSLEGRVLDDFDGSEAFDYLKRVHLSVQSGGQEAKKLMPNSVAIDISNALSAYRKEDKKELDQLMSALLADGGKDEDCAPERYIVQKYYFKDKVAWSNDVGFLFSESGHYAEAVELLRRVVLDNPDRKVAYLNLADAYWGMNKKVEARENYQKYHMLMLAAGKKIKLPERLSVRMAGD
ncbi:tetratricopeptide repeat protein [Pseudomonas viridiflava]|uniref:tetratricopeptide repeat protein n=1 Tax=Pseudomonas viridiflava TaxID=33069 RepID=UPI000F08A086|nr:tetratricopeptide repeat protein [Pseudomonas viridiflava]